MLITGLLCLTCHHGWLNFRYRLHTARTLRSWSCNLPSEVYTRTRTRTLWLWAITTLVLHLVIVLLNIVVNWWIRLPSRISAGLGKVNSSPIRPCNYRICNSAIFRHHVVYFSSLEMHLPYPWEVSAPLLDRLMNWVRNINRKHYFGQIHVNGGLPAIEKAWAYRYPWPTLDPSRPADLLGFIFFDMCHIQCLVWSKEGVRSCRGVSRRGRQRWKTGTLRRLTIFLTDQERREGFVFFFRRYCYVLTNGCVPNQGLEVLPSMNLSAYRAALARF